MIAHLNPLSCTHLKKLSIFDQHPKFLTLTTTKAHFTQPLIGVHLMKLILYLFHYHRWYWNRSFGVYYYEVHGHPINHANSVLTYSPYYWYCLIINLWDFKCRHILTMNLQCCVIMRDQTEYFVIIRDQTEYYFSNLLKHFIILANVLVK